MYQEIFLLEQKDRLSDEDKERLAFLRHIVSQTNKAFIVPEYTEKRKQSDYPSVEDQLNIIDEKFNKGN